MNELIGLGDVIIAAGVVFAIFAFVAIIEKSTRTRESKNYRRFLSDMFVSAKIRELAKDESLNLEQEEESFKKYMKKEKRKTENYNIDDAVEEDLIDKVGKETVKKETK